MKSISEFFGRMRGTQAKSVYAIVAAQETIRDLTAINVPIANISYSNRTLVIGGLETSARTTIYIKKSKIIESLNKKGIGRIVEDITAR